LNAPGGIDESVSSQGACSLQPVWPPAAVAREETAPGLKAEFHRRARIGTGGAQAIPRLYPLPVPRFGWTALSFLSHKVLRWLSPLFLIGLIFSNALLLTDRLYASLFLAQSGFYFVAAVNSRLKFRGQLGRVLHLPALFVTVNAALLVRLVRWLRNQQSGVWIRTPRTG
jgi:hypothetical protein